MSDFEKIIKIDPSKDGHQGWEKVTRFEMTDQELLRMRESINEESPNATSTSQEVKKTPEQNVRKSNKKPVARLQKKLS